MTGPDSPAPSPVPHPKGQIAVTDRTVLPFNPQVLATALEKISRLMLAERVVIGPEYDSVLSTTVDAVRIDVTGRPFDRAPIVTALGDPAPFEWQADDGWFRDWRGVLLTMPVVVYEGFPGVLNDEPPARDTAGDAEIVPAPSPVPTCHGARGGFEGDCGEPGPHGKHPLGDEPPPLGNTTVIIEPTGPAAAEWAERAGLEPADAKHWADPETAEAFRLVARGRARLEFKGRTFTTPAAALAALDAWEGRGLLTEGDVAQLAGELLEVPATPDRVRWPLVRGRRRTPARHGATPGSVA